MHELGESREGGGGGGGIGVFVASNVGGLDNSRMLVTSCYSILV